MDVHDFHIAAAEKLHFPVIWWDDAQRQAIADGFGIVVKEKAWGCYAVAILRNHIHMLFRKQNAKAEEISAALKEAGRGFLIARGLAPCDHPVFSADPCHHFKSTPNEVSQTIDYIYGNYAKHDLEPIHCTWAMNK